jgi:hypothetical protein
MIKFRFEHSKHEEIIVHGHQVLANEAQDSDSFRFIRLSMQHGLHRFRDAVISRPLFYCRRYVPCNRVQSTI